MPMVTGGSNAPLWGAWDFGNPKNWVINKPLSQNIAEFSTGIQVMGLSLPSATIGRFPGAVSPLAGRGAAAASGAGSAAASGAGVAATTAATVLPKALDLAEDLTLTGALALATQWLTKYWWIPTIFIGLWTVGKFGGK